MSSLPNGQVMLESVDEDMEEPVSTGSGILDQDMEAPFETNSTSQGYKDTNVLRLEQNLERDQNLVQIYCHVDKAAAFMEDFRKLASINSQTLSRQDFRNSSMVLISGKLEQDPDEANRECPGTPPLFEDDVDDTGLAGHDGGKYWTDIIMFM